jgi:7,8-dihydro-6-hydroxymethylpterin dimethyltransferase
MSEAELRAIIAHIVANDPERRIINITGGEPTQHPQFERMIELCHEAGIHRITVSTHGLRFLKDEALVQRLAALDARVVLSFDSFRQETNKEMLGGSFLDGKLRVLDLLEKYSVNTTLLPVLAKGVNSDEVGEFIKLALTRPFVRSLELHTMTYTGQSGANFDKASRYTPIDVLRDIEEQTDGMLRVSDFVPSPAAHPLCYQVTYLLQTGPGAAVRDWLPFARFMSPNDIRSMLAGHLYLEPSAQMESTIADVINRLWSGDIECDRGDEALAALRRIVDEVFDPSRDAADRMRASEQSAKAIYVHSHMDEDTFDTDRIRQCCVGIREPDGRNIPSCAYNVLYRERDERFTGSTASKQAQPLITLGKGRRDGTTTA